MYYLFVFFLLFCLFFVISVNRKRISPNLANKYIVSPIDGWISGIHMINLENDDNLYIEIIIKFNRLSSPYLYSPISGSYNIISNESDCFVVGFEGEEQVRLYHGWSFLINHFNYPILKKISLHNSECFKVSESYGVFYFGSYVKIIIDSKHLIVGAIGQNVIGGESILAIIQ